MPMRQHPGYIAGIGHIRSPFSVAHKLKVRAKNTNYFVSSSAYTLSNQQKNGLNTELDP